MYAMYPHNYSPDTLGVMVVTAPVVFLLCWLYNAHRLGKFKKKQPVPANIACKSTRKKWLFLICGMTAGIVLGLVLRFGF